MTSKEFFAWLWSIVIQCMSIELTFFEYRFTLWQLFIAVTILELIAYLIFNRINKD